MYCKIYLLSALIFLFAILLFRPSHHPSPSRTMSLTIKTAPHRADQFKEYRLYGEGPKDAEGLFNYTCSFRKNASKLLGSSFDPSQRVYYTANRFVDTVLCASIMHHTLVIRPDDV